MDIEKFQEAACTLSFIPGMKTIKSEPVGVWNAEYTRNNLEDIKKMADKYEGEKWAFMGVLINMAPVVDTEASKVFASFHDELQKKGAVAIAFVVGGGIALKAQTNRHKSMSSADKIIINHFRTEEKAIEWLKTLGV